MTIESIIKLIDDTKPYELQIAGLNITFESHYDKPVKWDAKYFVEVLNIGIPEDLQSLWHYVSQLYIAQDMTYGQWGLFIWSPDETLENNQNDPRYNYYHLMRGEIIIGNLIGDSDIVIMRCDKNQDDFGAIILAEAIVDREEYEIVASSLSEFLERFLQSPHKKFW